MEALEEVNRSILSCKKCDLYFSRKRAVCGTGNSDPFTMIIGEAPGSREDELGIPFIGRSGKLLRGVLEKCGMSLDEIYISNSVRCRPKIGKSPKISEVKKCSGYLRMEISLLKPKLIIPMGNSSIRSLGFIFGTDFGPVSDLEGEILIREGIFIAPQFHPAAILRNPKRYEKFKDNFMVLGNFVKDFENLEMPEIMRNFKVRKI